MPSRLAPLACVTLVALIVTGCKKPPEPLPIGQIDKDYNRPLAPGQWGLRKIDPSQYPDFGAAWFRAKSPDLQRAVDRSLHYLAKPSSQKYFPSGPIPHARVVASLKLFQEMLAQARTPELMNQMIRDKFDVYMSVGCDDGGTVLFTGYYSPIFNGSLTRTEQYKYPLYKLPPGFKKDEEGNPVEGMWHTREEIERQNLLAGNEIVWLGDRFEAYVFTVQGSGFIRLPDQSLYEIGYDGHNGHEYVSIGRILVADGKLTADKLSLDSLIRYFQEHPEAQDTYLYQNKRYVFFHEAKGGPFGCLNEPVTPEYSIATDKDIFPRASLTFVDTRIPQGSDRDSTRFRSFSLDQDRGAAIRAPGRCDVYMGVGEEAGRRAGFTYSEGKLYYLFAKEGLAPTAPGAAQPPPQTGAVEN